MKAIYDATRQLLYPRAKGCEAGVAFAHGVNPYRPRLRQALVNFEHANRGHRHLLSTPALAIANAPRRVGPYADQRYRTMRATLRDSTYALVLAIIHGHPHAKTLAFEALLDVSDDSGWISHMTGLELYRLGTNNRKIGLDRSFYLMLKMDIQESQVLMSATVSDKVTHASAIRELPAIPVSAAKLGSLATLLRETQKALTALCADVAAWPEFCNRDELIASFDL